MKRLKKVLSILLCLSMLASMTPVYAVDGTDEHAHEHIITDGNAAKVECSCEAEAGDLHAPFCALYEFPEKPECKCVEKCPADAANAYCDVCYFSADECTGGGEQAALYSGSYTDAETGITYTYNSENRTAVVTGYTGSGAELLVPPIVPIEEEDYLVTGVGAQAFENCTQLTVVVLPASVTTIGSGAFAGCTGLESVGFGGKTPPYMAADAFPGQLAPLVVTNGDGSGYYAAGLNIYVRPDLSAGQILSGWMLNGENAALPEATESGGYPYTTTGSAATVTFAFSEAEPVEKYTITWTNGDGGSYEKDYALGSKITVPSGEIFEDTMRKSCHEVIDWICSVEGIGVDSAMPAQELTFTAVYALTEHIGTATATNNGDGTHDGVWNCCGMSIDNEKHSINETGLCQNCPYQAETVYTTGDGLTYGTLQNAMEANLTGSGIITMLQDVKVGGSVIFGMDSTLDLNGHSITPTDDTVDALLKSWHYTAILDETGNGSIVHAGSAPAVIVTAKYLHLLSGTIQSTGGQAVQVNGDGFQISGGTVQGKTYGVEMLDGKLILRGSPVIKGDTADIYLADGASISVSVISENTYSVLTKAVPTADAPVVFAEPSGSITLLPERFSSARNDTHVALNANGELEIRLGACSHASISTAGRCETCGTQFEASYTTADGAAFDTLEKALANVADGGTVTLLKDVTGFYTTEANINNTVILELNGKTVSSTSTRWPILNIGSSGNLTVQDSSSEKTGKLESTDNMAILLNSYGGSLTVLSGTISGTPGIISNAKTNIQIKGGTVLGTGGSGTGIYVTSESALTVAGGTVNGGSGYGIQAMLGSTVDITGSAAIEGGNYGISAYNLTFSGGSSTVDGGIQVINHPGITPTGLTVESGASLVCNGKIEYYTTMGSPVPITVNGLLKVNASNYAFNTQNSSSTIAITVEGGVLDATASSIVARDKATFTIKGNSHVRLQGNIYTNALNVEPANYFWYCGDTAPTEGYTHSSTKAAAFVHYDKYFELFTGDHLTFNAETTTATCPHGVSFPVAASVTATDDSTTYYTELATALKAATNGSTVKLLKGVTTNRIIHLTGNDWNLISLDLNGNTVQGTHANAVFKVIDGKTVTLKNSASGSATIVTATGWGVQVDDGELIIEDGVTIMGADSGVNFMDGRLIVNGGSIRGLNTNNGSGIVIGGGIAEVKGGTITGGRTGIHVSGGTVTVTGGSILGENYGIYAAGENALVTVDGGTLEGSYALYTNGAVTLNGGTLNGRQADIVVAKPFTVGDLGSANHTLTTAPDNSNLPVQIAKGAAGVSVKPAWFTYVYANGEADNHYVILEGDRQVNGAALIEGGQANELYLYRCDHSVLGNNGVCDTCGTAFAALVIDGDGGSAKTAYYATLEAAVSAANTSRTDRKTILLLRDATGDITVTGDNIRLTCGGDNYTLKGTVTTQAENTLLEAITIDAGEDYGVVVTAGYDIILGHRLSIESSKADIYLHEGSGIDLSQGTDERYTVSVEDLPDTIGGKRLVSAGSHTGKLSSADDSYYIAAENDQTYLANRLRSVTVTLGDSDAAKGSEPDSWTAVYNGGEALALGVWIDEMGFEKSLYASWWNGNTKMDSAPTDAGTYGFKLISMYTEDGGDIPSIAGIVSNANYEGTLTITKASLSHKNITAFLTPERVTYDGKEHIPTVTVKDGDTLLTENTDYMVAMPSDMTVCQAAPRSIDIVGTGNYKDSVSLSFYMDKATPAADDFVFTPPANLTYDGQPKEATLAVAEGINGIGHPIMKYFLNGEEVAEAIDAGTYTVTVDVLEGSNYNEAADVTDDSWTFTIEKAPVKHYGNDISVNYYGKDLPLDVLFTLDKNAGAATYRVTPGTGVGELVDGSKLRPTLAGSFTITVTTAETDNYLSGSRTITLTVNRGDPLVYPPTGLTATYGDTLADVEFPADENGTWAWADSSAKVGSAGSRQHEAIFIHRESGVYNTVSAKLTVQVNKAVLTDVPVPTVTAPAAMAAAQTELDKGEHYSATLLWDPDAKVFGFDTEYTASFSMVPGSNYVFDKDVIAEVKAAMVADGWMVFGNEKSMSFQKTFAATGSSEFTATYGDKLSAVALPEGWSWENKDAYVGDVGEQSHKALYTLPSGETASLMIPIAVEAKELSIVGITLVEKNWDGTREAAVESVTLSGIVESDDVAVDLSKVTASLPGSNAGSYNSAALADITLTGSDAGNYSIVPAAEVPGTYGIQPKNIDQTMSYVTPGAMTYTGKAQEPELILSDGETPIPAEEYTVSYSNNTNAGEASIHVKPVNGGNYTFTAFDVSFTIEKAKITITADSKFAYLGGYAPVPTYTVTGLIDGEKLLTEPAAAYEKTPNMRVEGTTNILVSGAEASANYTIEYVPGKLTVAVRPVEVTVNMDGIQLSDKVYDGQALTYTGEATVTGHNLRFTYTLYNQYGYAVHAPKNAGTYTLRATVNTHGYTGYGEKTVTIEKATVTVSAADLTVNIGEELPELSYTITGLAEGQKLRGEVTIACQADMDTAGDYAITVSGGRVPDRNNYMEEIVYVDGTLTVVDPNAVEEEPAEEPAETPEEPSVPVIGPVTGAEPDSDSSADAETGEEDTTPAGGGQAGSGWRFPWWILLVIAAIAGYLWYRKRKTA